MLEMPYNVVFSRHIDTDKAKFPFAQVAQEGWQRPHPYVLEPFAPSGMSASGGAARSEVCCTPGGSRGASSGAL